MTKEIFIRMIEDGKQSELNFSDPDIGTERKLLGGVLAFMGIQLTESDLHIQKLYEEFYSNISNPSFTESNEEIKAKISPVKEEETKEESEEELYKRGIKINVRGAKIYRCRYICTNCNHTGNHFILPEQEEIPCHECGESLTIQKLDGLDEFKSHYKAGNYKK